MWLYLSRIWPRWRKLHPHRQSRCSWVSCFEQQIVDLYFDTYLALFYNNSRLILLVHICLPKHLHSVATGATGGAQPCERHSRLRWCASARPMGAWSAQVSWWATGRSSLVPTSSARHSTCPTLLVMYHKQPSRSTSRSFPHVRFSLRRWSNGVPRSPMAGVISPVWNWTASRQQGPRQSVLLTPRMCGSIPSVPLVSPQAATTVCGPLDGCSVGKPPTGS